MDILSSNGPERKICTKCGKPRLLNEFYNHMNDNGKTYRESSCKFCSHEYNKRYQRENPLSKRRAKLRYEFGIELEEYDTMLEARNGLCAMCGEPETSIDHQTGKIRRLAIDHDHENGKIRALLCKRCNSNLDRFERARQKREEKLARYIAQYKIFQDYLDHYK